MRRRLAARAAASWPYLLVGAWIVGSTALFDRTGIDVRLPCMFEAIFGVECPGCGLSRALQALLHGDLAAAWAHNPLVFVVLPAGAFYWVKGRADGGAAASSSRKLETALS